MEYRSLYVADLPSLSAAHVGKNTEQSNNTHLDEEFPRRACNAFVGTVNEIEKSLHIVRLDDLAEAILKRSTFPNTLAT